MLCRVRSICVSIGYRNPGPGYWGSETQGLPVVAVKGFGSAEMVRHMEDGLLTELSVNSFAEAITKLLQNNELYRK